MPNSSPATHEPDVQQLVAAVGDDLAHALTTVLTEIPGSPHRPLGLARALGLNVVLTSRLLKALRQRDALAVMHLVPGPEPLRRLLAAAEQRGVGAEQIAAARAAIDRFERLIDVDAGDRGALDALISGWLPGAREKVELLAKQSLFRGISQLLGTASEVEITTLILHPSPADPTRADVLAIVASRGLRRTRPGQVVKYDTIHAATPLLSIAGEPVSGLHNMLLESFCSRPLPDFQISRVGDTTQYTLRGEGVGLRSGVDIAYAALLPAHKELLRPAADPPRRATFAVGVATPTRLLVFDVLLHPDVYPGQAPALKVYRSVGVYPRERRLDEPDRLDILESVQPLTRGIGGLRCAEAPGYADMVAFACSQRGWAAEALRGFRCRIDYPMYSAEVALEFAVESAT